jgi:hypothetical protein
MKINVKHVNGMSYQVILEENASFDDFCNIMEYSDFSVFDRTTIQYYRMKNDYQSETGTRRYDFSHFHDNDYIGVLPLFAQTEQLDSIYELEVGKGPDKYICKQYVYWVDRQHSLDEFDIDRKMRIAYRSHAHSSPEKIKKQIEFDLKHELRTNPYQQVILYETIVDGQPRYAVGKHSPEKETSELLFFQSVEEALSRRTRFYEHGKIVRFLVAPKAIANIIRMMNDA